jgi:hypothetical protein
VVLHGHGLRERQLWGPLEPDGEPKLTVVKMRRYRCIACGAITTVGPSETLTRRMYSVSAIALALALHGLQRLGSAAVRKLVSPMRVIAVPSATWVTLRRWCRAVGTPKLLESVRRIAGSSRAVAAEAAASLSAYVLPSLEPPSLIAQAFHGAVHAR